MIWVPQDLYQGIMKSWMIMERRNIRTGRCRIRWRRWTSHAIKALHFDTCFFIPWQASVSNALWWNFWNFNGRYVTLCFCNTSISIIVALKRVAINIYNSYNEEHYDTCENPRNSNGTQLWHYTSKKLGNAQQILITKRLLGYTHHWSNLVQCRAACGANIGWLRWRYIHISWINTCVSVTPAVIWKTNARFTTAITVIIITCDWIIFCVAPPIAKVWKFTLGSGTAVWYDGRMRRRTSRRL